MPTIEGGRYDLVLDDGDRLYPVQVKYRAVSPYNCEGSVVLNLSTWTRGGKVQRSGYTDKEIDAILVYLPQIDRIAWIGPEFLRGKTKLQIRFNPSKNGQTKSCFMVNDMLW